MFADFMVTLGGAIILGAIVVVLYRFACWIVGCDLHEGGL